MSARPRGRRVCASRGGARQQLTALVAASMLAAVTVGAAASSQSTSPHRNSVVKPRKRPEAARPTPPPPPHPVKPAASVMFNCTNASWGDRRTVFEELAAAGVAWVRINFNWKDVQPSDPSTYDGAYLATLDDCVQLANADGIKVLVVFLASPDWAASGPGWNTPPRDPALFANAIGYLAGYFRGRVAAWEIWNEENTPSYWTGTAAAYVSLLKAAYGAVKDADPNALVVFGGTAYNDDLFVAAAYAAGAKGSFDVMATHPYQQNPEHNSDPPATPDAGPMSFTHAPAVHQVMVANGDGAKPIWFTEVGWSAPGYVTLDQQAQYLTQMLDYTEEHFAPWATNVFWFQAVNEVPSLAPDSWEVGLALLNPDLTPRPALAALSAWVHG